MPKRPVVLSTIVHRGGWWRGCFLIQRFLLCQGGQPRHQDTEGQREVPRHDQGASAVEPEDVGLLERFGVEDVVGAAEHAGGELARVLVPGQARHPRSGRRARTEAGVGGEVGVQDTRPAFGAFRLGGPQDGHGTLIQQPGGFGQLADPPVGVPSMPVDHAAAPGNSKIPDRVELKKWEPALPAPLLRRDVSSRDQPPDCTGSSLMLKWRRIGD